MTDSRGLNHAVAAGAVARRLPPGVTPRWWERNGTFQLLQRHYGPAHWHLMVLAPQRAYEWICPTVAQLDELYGRGSARTWVDQQLTALFLTSGSRDGTLSTTIGLFADTFAATIGHFKLSEVMLFFGRYRTGIYDGAFATFDARRIGQAFHTEFLRERRKELAHLEELRQAAEKVREERLRRRHAISYERYRTAPPDRRYGLRLRLHADAPPATLQTLIDRYGAAPPDERGCLTLTLTGEAMARLCASKISRHFTVTDSWEVTP